MYRKFRHRSESNEQCLLFIWTMPIVRLTYSNVGEDGSGSCVEESWMPVEDVVGGAVRPDEEETKLQEGGQHRPHRFVGWQVPSSFITVGTATANTLIQWIWKRWSQGQSVHINCYHYCITVAFDFVQHSWLTVLKHVAWSVTSQYVQHIRKVLKICYIKCFSYNDTSRKQRMMNISAQTETLCYLNDILKIK